MGGAHAPNPIAALRAIAQNPCPMTETPCA